MNWCLVVDNNCSWWDWFLRWCQGRLLFFQRDLLLWWRTWHRFVSYWSWMRKCVLLDVDFKESDFIDVKDRMGEFDINLRTFDVGGYFIVRVFAEINLTVGNDNLYFCYSQCLHSYTHYFQSIIFCEHLYWLYYQLSFNLIISVSFF